MFIVSPSIYSADFLHLADQLDSLASISNLHLDIDDGNFVRGISFGMKIAEQIAARTTIPLDAHLEVLNPLEYIEPLLSAGIKQICAHLEQLPYPHLFLSAVHQSGGLAGLSLNLKTPLGSLEPYAQDVDFVLLVSVEADHEGLPFRPSILKKIREARRILPKETRIWVDGGINLENLALVIEAGADAVVMGRAIFESSDPKLAWEYYQSLGECIHRKRERGACDDNLSQ
jgi:ribulose-phosphate 3-epimerase